MRAASLVAYAQFGKQLVGLIVTVVLARLLTPTDYGVIAASQTLVGTLAVFGSLGLYDVVVQKTLLRDEDADALFFVSVVVGLCLFVVCCVSGRWLAVFYSSPDLLLITPIAGLALVLTSLGQIHAAMLARSQQYRAMIGIEFFGQIVAAVVAVAFAALGYGYWALVMLGLTAAASTAFASWIRCSWRPRWPKTGSLRRLHSSLAFGAGIAIGNGLNNLTAQADKLVVGQRIGIAELGFYSRAQQLSLYASNIVFVGPHRFVTSQLARKQGSDKEYKIEFIRILGVAVWISVIFNALLAINSQAIVRLVLGMQWEQMHGIFAVAAIGNAAYVMAFAYQWLHLSRDTGARYFRANLARLVLVSGAAFVGSVWGAMGVAVACAMATWVMAALTANSCARDISARPFELARLLMVPALVAAWSGLLALSLVGSDQSTLQSAFLRSLVFVSFFFASSWCLCREQVRAAFSLLASR